ncbi:peptidase [Streptomyces sp. NPDC051582]|uniref:peptidase n=1 Tax=Streptomyces sp. NPDC051582 TaxID=3155167 RepID=UPI003412F9BE
MDKRISLLAATGLAALSLGAAAPALAAEPAFPLGGPSALVLQPYPDTGASKERSLHYTLDYVGPGNSFPGEFTVTVDLSKVAGVASVRPDPAKPRPNCTTSATAIVCKQQGLSADTPNANRFDLLVSAAKGTKSGASGEIAVTGRVAGASVTPVTTKLTVGGPDLYMGELGLRSEVTAGEQQDLPLAFANRGTLPARSVALELDASAGLQPARTYDNCRVQDHGGMGATTVCLVEGEFLPGESYRLAPDSPLQLKTTERAYRDRLRYAVVPDPAPREDAHEGGPATGRTLKLVKSAVAVPVTGSAAAEPAGHAENTDLNPGDNERDVAFTAKGARADFEAVTASPSGKVGDTVVAELGFRNKGPAVISHLRSGESVARTDIVMPAGVQVTDVPRNCRAVNADGSDRSDRLGAPRYFCDGGIFADFGSAYTGRFTMKIEKAVADAKGSVTVGEPVAGGTRPPAFDPVAGNAKAVFAVEVKGGTSPSPSPSGSASASPSPSASASASASASPSTSATAAAGAAGGNLASTGSSVGPIALGALGAVAVGGALYVGVRRRSGGHA